METQSTASEQRDRFRDPTALTNWTRGLLCASVAVSAFLLWTQVTEYQALLRGDTVPLLPLWAIPVLPMAALLTSVVILVWVHRANCNVRALGATRLKFTPGWAVGWFFVPIANLWKPFQAMLEIWRASVNPREWRRRTGSPLLWCWWSLWVLNIVVVNGMELAGLIGMFADDANGEILKSATNAIRAGLRIPAALFLVSIIGRVHRMQMAHYRRQVAAGDV